jgi:pyruvate/2-oxoglutarate dehydrogenase complex dihydrolipoamide dehydrogenase (E3) component
MYDYDVIVLGGGSAGTYAAAAAAGVGARTAMINDGELGGLCILRGCMPSKAMLASAHALHETTRLEPFGLQLDGRAEPDFERIMQRKDALVRRFQRAKIGSIEAEDYEVISGRGRFVAEDAVEVDGRRLTANAFVVSTGSTPHFLPLPGIDAVPVLTSDDVMQLKEQPRVLLVQGAGFVGLELSQFFARIGTRVLLVNRSPMLSHLDTECGEELGRALGEELELAVPGAIEELRGTGSGLVARVRAGGATREVEADALLMATGRRAALDDLGLEQVGLEPSPVGLGHDDRMCTANPRVWVAGDATGDNQLLHVSAQEGRAAGHNAAGGRPEKRIDRRLEMFVVFTDPPYAQVGLTEAVAREQGREVLIGRAHFPGTGRAITMETRHGLWKLLADPAGGRILGSAILGPRADDLIHEVALMMAYGAKFDDFPDLPWYHPTLSEVMLNLGRDLTRQRGDRRLPPGAPN